MMPSVVPHPPWISLSLRELVTQIVLYLTKKILKPLNTIPYYIYRIEPLDT